MALILGLESTCDETAAAIVADGRQVLSNIVASQAQIHAKYRGVVPEIASRAHIENILPVIRESLSQAKLNLGDMAAVSITNPRVAANVRRQAPRKSNIAGVR